jgi:hypothetical protein
VDEADFTALIVLVIPWEGVAEIVRRISAVAVRIGRVGVGIGGGISGGTGGRILVLAVLLFPVTVLLHLADAAVIAYLGQPVGAIRFELVSLVVNSADSTILGVHEYAFVAAIVRRLAPHVMIVGAAVGAGSSVEISAVAGEEGIILTVDVL